MLFHACVINHTVCGLRMCNTHDINAMVWSEWCSYWCVTFHLGAITNFTVAPQQPKDSLIHKWWTTYLNCQYPRQYIFNKNKSRQNSFLHNIWFKYQYCAKEKIFLCSIASNATHSTWTPAMRQTNPLLKLSSCRCTWV